MCQARSLTLVGRLWLKLSMASLLALFCCERVLSAARGLWGWGRFSPLFGGCWLLRGFPSLPVFLGDGEASGFAESLVWRGTNADPLSWVVFLAFVGVLCWFSGIGACCAVV